MCEAQHNKAVGNLPMVDDGRAKVGKSLNVGARVMLTLNLNTKHGLYNGTIGTVEHVLFEDQEAFDRRTPYMALLKIDQYDKLHRNDAAYFDHPDFGNNLVPITLHTDRCQYNGTSIQRKGLPLKLGYAMTIHKSQGQSLDHVIIVMDGLESAKEANVLFYVGTTSIRW